MDSQSDSELSLGLGPPVGEMEPGDQNLYVNAEYLRKIKSLEWRWDLLHKEEIEVDKRHEQIIMSLVTIVNVYVVITGVMFLGGILISNTRTLVLLLGMIFVTFFTGVGSGSYSCYMKLVRMHWKMDQIRRERVKLWDGVEKLHTSVRNHAIGPIGVMDDTISKDYAERRITEMLQALETEHGGFDKENRWLLIVSFAVSSIYLVSSICWTYFMHTGAHIGGVQIPV